MRWLKNITNFGRQCIWGVIGANDSDLAARLRQKIYRTVCKIDTNVLIKNPNNFRSGHGSALYHACYILNTFGSLRMGNNSHLGAFCYVNVCYGNVTIGDDVAIGPGTKIFAYSNHFEKGKKVTDVRIVNDIVIGNNAFIGANCTILPGTIIHDNVIVAAGAVVKGELASNAMYGGIPCKLITPGWYV